MAEEKGSYAPFVSMLRAYKEGERIKLTWQDSESPVKHYTIYRNLEEITRSTVKGMPEKGWGKGGLKWQRGEFFNRILTFPEYPGGISYPIVPVFWPVPTRGPRETGRC